MQATLDFIKLLHPSLKTGEFIELRSWAQNNKAPTQFFSSDYDKLDEWVVAHYHNENVFIGVLPRTGKGGTRDNVKRGCWLWADLDSDKLKRSGNNLINYISTHFILPPTLLVASHGDEGGIHAYWQVEETEDIDKIEAYNDKLAYVLGSDKVSDAARILRVVGSLNHKYNPPIPVHQMKHVPVKYTFEEITQALALPEKWVKLAYSGSTDGHQSRSERDFALIGALIRAGFSDELIKVVFANSHIGDKYAEEGAHYLDTSIEKMRGKEQPTGINKWGIVEKAGCYWRILADGSLSQLSTFVFEPQVLLEGNTKHEEDTLLGMMQADGLYWLDVPLGKKAFTDNAGMAKALPKASWQWLGKDSDVKRLLPYLLDKLKEANGGLLPSKVKTGAIGRYDNLFVLDGQVFNETGLLPNEQAPIVWLSTDKDFPSIRYEPLAYDQFYKELEQFAMYAMGINKYEVVLIMLGWLVASFYKPLLNEQGIHLPILNMFGTRGSGKSTLVKEFIQRLAGYTQPRTYDSNTTRFVMLSLLGCSNAVPVTFDEYRVSSMKDPDQLPGYVRLSYDSGHDSRGRSDQSMIDYALSASLIIVGEDALGDPACLERTIQLNLHPEVIVEGSQAFKCMQALAGVNLNAIGYELMRYCLSTPFDFDTAYTSLHSAFATHLPDRVRRNFAVVLAGINKFREFMLLHGFKLDDIEDSVLFEEALTNVVNVETGRTVLPVDEMITDMVLYIQQNQGLDQFVFRYDPDTYTVYFNFTSVYGWWARTKRSAGRNVLADTALKRQLKERMVTDDRYTAGNYIVDKKNVSANNRTHLMYAVSLSLAHAAGLDVPDSIDKFVPKITKVLDKLGAKL